MLELRGIDAGYGRVAVLRGVSLTVAPGEILCLMGRNGAGKTTLCKAIMGLVPLTAGGVWLEGEEISRLPAHEAAKAGIGLVPQGRRLFAELTVAENLAIGLGARGRGQAALDRALALFPRLEERMGQRAGTLSGGEQQMLAMARALCLEPSVLLMDEPTEGLQPSMASLIRETAATLRDCGTAILLVEQRVETVLALADRVAFLETGRLAETLPIESLRTDRTPFQRFVGVAG
ncbi:MAG: ABC transporter ATP-binding protein [Pseudomonadota bacterium]